MAYLEFNKEELVNLEYSLEREILLSNRAGGYVNTTIVGCNTRKYHGLLVVPIENFGGNKHILLSTKLKSQVLQVTNKLHCLAKLALQQAKLKTHMVLVASC